jgi:hypothetical protein
MNEMILYETCKYGLAFSFLMSNSTMELGIYTISEEFWVWLVGISG